MSNLLEKYSNIVGREVIEQLKRLAKPLRGMKVLHVNSTNKGGGVAEILQKLIPLKNELNIHAKWLVIEGDKDFFICTKNFHNALQGKKVQIPEKTIQNYERINAKNAEKFEKELNEADFVFIHDPQPAPLLSRFPNRLGKWIWRCHIDLSKPYSPIWKYLKKWVEKYDASIFSIPEFAQHLNHPQYIIKPSIDPLSEKNEELSENQINNILSKYPLSKSLPSIVQVSRFDNFKDPIGVIKAYKIAKRQHPLQLILAGGGAEDDPESEDVLKEVYEFSKNDSNIHILFLPPDAHTTINALQRRSDIIMQKSLKEGFGLTVTEGLWKEKPVIGGNVGGIRTQIINSQTGFLVSTPEGAALRINYLLSEDEKRLEMGKMGKKIVKSNFLITRHVKEYLTLMMNMRTGTDKRTEWDKYSWKEKKRL